MGVCTDDRRNMFLSVSAAMFKFLRFLSSGDQTFQILGLGFLSRDRGVPLHKRTPIGGLRPPVGGEISCVWERLQCPIGQLEGARETRPGFRLGRLDGRHVTRGVLLRKPTPIAGLRPPVGQQTHQMHTNTAEAH